MGKYVRLFPLPGGVVATHWDVWNKASPAFMGCMALKDRVGTGHVGSVKTTARGYKLEPLKTQAVFWQTLAGRISPVAWGLSGRLLCMVLPDEQSCFLERDKWQELGSTV